MLKKKYTALCLSALLATSLVACGNNDDTAEEIPKDADTTQTANDPKEPAEKTPDPSPVPYDYSKIRNGIIEMASIPNVSNYTYTVDVEPMEKEEDDLAPHLMVTVDIQNTTGADIQQLQYQSTFDQEWLDMFIGENGQLIRFVDLNFDGYADVVAQHQGAEVNQGYYVWLYDLESNQFVATDAYNGLTNLKIDRDKQYLLSTNYSQGIPTYALAQVVDGEVRLLGEILGSVDGEGNITYLQRMLATQSVEGVVTLLEVPVEATIANQMEADALWQGFSLVL